MDPQGYRSTGLLPSTSSSSSSLDEIFSSSDSLTPTVTIATTIVVDVHVCVCVWGEVNLEGSEKHCGFLEYFPFLNEMRLLGQKLILILAWEY
ncbi:hypothetical protein FQN52_007497 [Onygenales sp. PD_12]|nr:hypothetical protein FQN52_007497 [Onygenales sp. PD_12]